MVIFFIKKITVALSLWSLIISQSFAETAEIVDLYQGQSLTRGNLTFRCLSNSTTELASASSSSSTNYGQLMLTGLVGIVSTAIIGPTIKTRLIDPCLDKFSSKWGIPRCCRRESTEDMDIRVDLLSPEPPRSYRLLFDSLDASLVSVGWGKYPVIDEDDHLVGYRYLFLGSDKQEKASIYLVREYQTLKAQKGLLRLNKSLRPRALKVGTLENIHNTEVGPSSNRYYSYEMDYGRIAGKEFPLQRATQSSATSSNNNSSVSSDPNTFLQRFKQAFSVHTSVNAQQFLEETLELYRKNVGIRLEINDAGSYACLDCGFLSSSNFYLYYIIGQNKA